MKKYIVKNVRWLVLFLVAVLLSNVAAVIVQFLKGDVLNLALGQSYKNFITSVCFLLCAIGFEIFFTYLTFRFENRFKNYQIKSIKEDFFKSILGMGCKRFREEGNEKILAKYTVTIPEIQNRYISSTTLLFSFLVKIISITCALVSLDWRLAILTLLLLSMPIYIPKFFEKKIQIYQKNHVEKSNELMAFLTNVLEGFEVIKNFSIERKFQKKYNTINGNAISMTLKNDDYGTFMRILMSCMSYFSYFAVIAFSGWLVYKGEFNAGEFFVAVGMIDQLSYPIIGISGCLQGIVAMKPLLKETEDFLTYESEKKEVSIVDFNNEIKCRNISFKYDETWILRDVDFDMKKNGKYLIVGENGSGKTTFVNCLLKYHLVDEGEILIDGVDIKDIGDIYNICSILRQNVFLFADSLRNNVTLFNDAISDEKIIDVLRRLNLEKYANVEALDMMVGSGGVNLSAGEQRKVGLARVLLTDRNILILDEPLSNLDQESKDVVMSNILDINDRTVILISHEWLERTNGSVNQFTDVLKI